MRPFEKLLDDKSIDELNNMVRWDDMSKIKDETVSHHSYIVTYITRILSEEIFTDCAPKLLATTYAIFHDVNEFITGDINHNVKYNIVNGTEMRVLLNNYIHTVVDTEYPSDRSKSDRMLNTMLKDDIPPFIKKLVKLADWMSMIMYLRKEESLGNRNARTRLEYCKEKMSLAADDALVALEQQLEYVVDCSILKYS